MAIRCKVRREIKCKSTVQYVVQIIYNGRSNPANKRKQETIKMRPEKMDRRYVTKLMCTKLLPSQFGKM
jgi:hypothetical protein